MNPGIDVFFTIFRYSHRRHSRSSAETKYSDSLVEYRLLYIDAKTTYIAKDIIIIYKIMIWKVYYILKYYMNGEIYKYLMKKAINKNWMFDQNIDDMLTKWLKFNRNCRQILWQYFWILNLDKAKSKVWSNQKIVGLISIIGLGDFTTCTLHLWITGTCHTRTGMVHFQIVFPKFDGLIDNSPYNMLNSMKYTPHLEVFFTEMIKGGIYSTSQATFGY